MAVSKSLLMVQWIALGVMVLGIIAQRLQLLPFRLAFGGFALSLLVLAVVALIALVIVVLSFAVLDASWRANALWALLLGLLPLVLVGILVGQGFKVPKIHDISTNTDNNIAFVHAQDLRRSEHNSLALPSPDVVAQQHAYYPALAPLKVKDTPAQAFEKSVRAVQQLGWTITHQDPQRRHLELIEKTAIFGFVDDAAIRVTATEEGALVDMRSVSRLGVSDLGANAKRIQRFQSAYRAL